MADRADAAIARHMARLKSRRSVTGTYARGEDTCTWDATRGQTDFRIGDDYGGTRIERTDADFIGEAATLKFGSEQVTPERGDTFTVNGKVYNVAAPNNEQPYRMDETGTMLRIHTKLAGDV